MFDRAQGRTRLMNAREAAQADKDAGKSFGSKPGEGAQSGGQNIDWNALINAGRGQAGSLSPNASLMGMSPPGRISGNGLRYDDVRPNGGAGNTPFSGSPISLNNPLNPTVYGMNRPAETRGGQAQGQNISVTGAPPAQTFGYNQTGAPRTQTPPPPQFNPGGGGGGGMAGAGPGLGWNRGGTTMGIWSGWNPGSGDRTGTF